MKNPTQRRKSIEPRTPIESLAFLSGLLVACPLGSAEGRWLTFHIVWFDKHFLKGG